MADATPSTPAPTPTASTPTPAPKHGTWEWIKLWFGIAEHDIQTGATTLATITPEMLAAVENLFPKAVAAGQSAVSSLVSSDQWKMLMSVLGPLNAALVKDWLDGIAVPAVTVAQAAPPPAAPAAH